MPTPINPANSLHSFDPRLRKMLEAGTRMRIVIVGDKRISEYDEYRRLIHLRQRLNLLRHDLQKIDPEASKHLYRCEVKVHRPTLTLTIQPRDSGFNDLLSQFEAMPDVQTVVLNPNVESELDDIAGELD